ncbi:hypothetical protein DSECCO2_547120 [anaerobic digester metagenome]
MPGRGFEVGPGQVGVAGKEIGQDRRRARLQALRDVRPGREGQAAVRRPSLPARDGAAVDVVMAEQAAGGHGEKALRRLDLQADHRRPVRQDGVPAAAALQEDAARGDARRDSGAGVVRPELRGGHGFWEEALVFNGQARRCRGGWGGREGQPAAFEGEPHLLPVEAHGSHRHARVQQDSRNTGRLQVDLASRFDTSAVRIQHDAQFVRVRRRSSRMGSGRRAAQRRQECQGQACGENPGEPPAHVREADRPGHCRRRSRLGHVRSPWRDAGRGVMSRKMSCIPCSASRAVRRRRRGPGCPRRVSPGPAGAASGPMRPFSLPPPGPPPRGGCAG